MGWVPQQDIILKKDSDGETADQIERKIANLQATLRHDQVAVFAEDNHAGMIQKNYIDQHLVGELPVWVWVLP